MPLEPPQMTQSQQVAGYVVSFWFWHHLREYRGPGAIRDIMAWLRRPGDKQLERLLERVSELSDETVAPRVELKTVLRDIEELRSENE